MFFAHRFFAALVVTLAFASPASALTVTGQNYGADVSAEVDLLWNGSDTLTITIENTANAVAVTAAVVTGFAFNLPDEVTGVSGFSASGTLDDSAWAFLLPPGNAPGGYLFEIGAGTGPNIAGGSPNDGFAIGTTATFTFTFTGTLGGLTADDFLGELEDGASGPSDFGVRFQAIPDGAGSDFADGAGSDFALVPAPGVALLFAASLPAFLALRRR
ncbi:MAG: hypothetical protein JRH10_07220 [Deltaproteobacteria bacterium]|nr:hypothetical protein [Deltaproteobacteria bacterium]MBW2444821.1 hypothetical protein [Deltaproteobacteria bacterium]